MDAADERFMKEALELAERGIGAVEPNPAVGCVIVRDGRIIGRGWHKAFGGPHAEIEALADCRGRGIDPAGATVYVTLEPCCHYGKTGPCTEALIAARVARVVVAMQDPAGHCDGGGMARLRAAGIVVEPGCCERQARLLNAWFITWHRQGRTWVILKWAQSIDGYLAHRGEPPPRWISNALSREDSHRLRRRVQGILVGITTVLADDPLLTARPPRDGPPASPREDETPSTREARGEGWRTRDEGGAMRVVLDSSLRIPLGCRLVRTAGQGPVLVFARQGVVAEKADVRRRLSDAGVEVVPCPQAEGPCDPAFVLDELARRQVCQLVVEGGPTVLRAFYDRGLADEFCVYVAPVRLGAAGAAAIGDELMRAADGQGLYEVHRRPFADDVRVTGLTQRAIHALELNTVA